MVPLRRRLFLLVAAAIVPLAAIAGVGLLVLVTQQRTQAQRAGIELTRALATAVDAELGRSLAVLQAMATSPTLDTGNLPGFMERATRVLNAEHYWRAISLVDAAGTAVLHTRHPLGSALRGPVQDASVARVRETRAATVGGLALDPDDGQVATPSFRVLVPVIRQDALRLIAVAFVDPEAIVEILRRQRVPHDWVISIFDDQGLRVARSRAHAEMLGKPGAPSVVELMARPEPEGWGETTAVEGDPIYTAYSRVNTIPWTVATGIPRAPDVAPGAAHRRSSRCGARHQRQDRAASAGPGPRRHGRRRLGDARRRGPHRGPSGGAGLAHGRGRGRSDARRADGRQPGRQRGQVHEQRRHHPRPRRRRARRRGVAHHR